MRSALAQRALHWLTRTRPNWRGTQFAPPGHFYSPLLDIEASEDGRITHDGEALWQHVPLHEDEQRQLLEALLHAPDRIMFPARPSEAYRYFHDNGWFPLLDASVLAGLIQRLRPRHYLEVGSGYSTAVVLDTLDRDATLATTLTVVDPDLARMRSLLRTGDEARVRVHRCPVQELPLEAFTSLDRGDVLFIDSSHVAKMGSDVTWLVLHVLPSLRTGVWVHVHDIDYPASYPATWVREGRAWNESIVLRAFLIGNGAFRIRAFSAFARQRLDQAFWQAHPTLAVSAGTSFWMERVS